MKKIILIIIGVSLIVGGIYLESDRFLGAGDVFKDIPSELVIEELKILDPEVPEPEHQPEEPTTKTISILGVGDIMFHMPQINSARLEDGTYDFNPPFRYVKRYIEEVDIALANFETVTAGNHKGFSGFPRFNSPSETVEALKEVGFDILSTANNHSLDRGRDGIIATIENIEKNGLKNIGTYKDKDKSLLIEEIEGIKIGFLSYTYGMNGLDSLLTNDELQYMIDIINEQRIEEDIHTLKKSNVDLIVVYIHWGNEYQPKPHIYQEALGRNLIEWGANIVFGTHPHVIQRSEIVEHDGKTNYIIYSMGNFYSNQRYETMGNPYTEDGVMVNILVEKDLVNGHVYIKEVEHIPTWVYRYTESNKIMYDILPIKDVLDGIIDIQLPDTIIGRIYKSYEDTISTLEGNN